jgi:uncharacterized protein YdhG (YjbR/CyaY superfamily)
MLGSSCANFRNWNAMTITDHDAYIAAAAEPFRKLLSHLRALLAETLADADEVVAYNMPGFSVAGTVVASYAAFSSQCGLYLQPGVTADHAEELSALGLRATKTGITFSPRKPIPDDLVKRLARASRNATG